VVELVQQSVRPISQDSGSFDKEKVSRGRVMEQRIRRLQIFSNLAMHDGNKPQI
jgi:hypothetical protein